MHAKMILSKVERGNMIDDLRCLLRFSATNVMRKENIKISNFFNRFRNELIVQNKIEKILICRIE